MKLWAGFHFLLPSRSDYSVKVLGFPSKAGEAILASLEIPQPCQVQTSREERLGPFYDIINTNTVIKYL